VLGIDASRLRVARVLPGSVRLDFEVLEDPRIANAPIPPPVIDTSKNVDAATAAELAALPAEQQAAVLQQYYSASTGAPPPASEGAAAASPAAGGTGGDGTNSTGSTGPGPGGSTNATADGSSTASGGGSAAAANPDLGLTGNVTATVAAGQELLAVLAKLQAAAASGSLSESLGVEVLSMSAKAL
jgi:hypothetical protein